MQSKVPRQYSLVRFDFDGIDEKYHSQMPFTRKGVYVFFGEIPNMPSHCVIADHKTGQIYSGFHTDNFDLARQARGVSPQARGVSP